MLHEPCTGRQCAAPPRTFVVKISTTISTPTLACHTELYLTCPQEVQALAAIGSHPNIIQYYSSWTEPDASGHHWYIQLELCQHSLADEFRTGGRPLKEAELTELLKQVR